MKVITLSLTALVLLTACQASKNQSVATPTAETTVLCDGTVYNLQGKLSDDELNAFSGIWIGTTVGVNGRYEGCKGTNWREEQYLNAGNLSVIVEGTGHSCGQGQFTNQYVVPRERQRGQGFYYHRENGSQQYALWIEGDTLRRVSDTAESKTCWSATFSRVDQ